MIIYNFPSPPNTIVQTCPVGYEKTDNACIDASPLDVERFAHYASYDFEYYENAGELVGRYILGSQDVDEGLATLSNEDQVNNASPYFGQNFLVTSYANLGLANPKQIMNQDESVLILQVKHIDDVTPTVEIQHPHIDSALPQTNSIFTQAHLGEFHLITNTMKSIKRINCNVEVLQEFAQEADWLNDLGGSPDQPSLFEKDADTDFVEMYLGWTRVPLRDRPTTSLDRLGYPSIADPILATDWLKWKTLSQACSSYMRVYNGVIPAETFEANDIKDGHFICQVRFNINVPKLTTFLNTRFDTAAYAGGEKTYQIVIFPPSFYLYPAKNPVDFIRPIPNFVNREINDIVFKAPKNFKSDGNIHYKLEFYNSKSQIDTPIFTTSSFGDDAAYEEAFWEYSVTNLLNFLKIPKEQPTDDNQFGEDTGSPTNTTYIKYTLSEVCRAALDGKFDIIFKIKQLDGTLIEPYINT